MLKIDITFYLHNSGLPDSRIYHQAPSLVFDMTSAQNSLVLGLSIANF